MTTNALSTDTAATADTAESAVAKTPWPEGQTNAHSSAAAAIELVEQAIVNNLNPSPDFLRSYNKRNPQNQFRRSQTLSDATRRAVAWARTALVRQFTDPEELELFQERLKALDLAHPAPLRETGLLHEVEPPPLRGVAAPAAQTAQPVQPATPVALRPKPYSVEDVRLRLAEAGDRLLYVFDDIVVNRRRWERGVEDALISFYSTMFWQRIVADGKQTLCAETRFECDENAKRHVESALRRYEPRPKNFGRKGSRNGRNDRGNNRGPNTRR